MRAIVVGAVDSTRVALRAVSAARGWQVAALITLPSNLATRHSDFADLGAEAETCGARVIRAVDGNASEVLQEIRTIVPDYVFVIGWSQICKPAFLEAAGESVIGFHPSPLPRLRGRAVIPWTILLDEKIAGSTLFWMDEGVDTGSILAQRFFHVASDETAGSLYAQHLIVLGELLKEALPRLANGTAAHLPQDERYATWCTRRTAEDGLIDWTQPAAEIWRLVRAAGRPYPGAFTIVPGGYRLILWQALPWLQGGDARYSAMSGQVIARDTTGFAVRCGDGRDLWVKEFSWKPAASSENAALGKQSPPPLHVRLGRG
jgi:methionyl-tRNA formyltransferase